MRTVDIRELNGHPHWFMGKRGLSRRASTTGHRDAEVDIHRPDEHPQHAWGSRTLSSADQTGIHVGHGGRLSPASQTGIVAWKLAANLQRSWDKAGIYYCGQGGRSACIVTTSLVYHVH
ncbi:hypothetical protein BKA93DRAFT_748311 [Sparassis latifolia]